MKIRARRGVCIGVEKHLAVGEEAEIDGALVTFLVGIGAVELVPAAPVPQAASLESDQAAPQLDLTPAPASPEKAKKKEK